MGYAIIDKHGLSPPSVRSYDRQEEAHVEFLRKVAAALDTGWTLQVLTMKRARLSRDCEFGPVQTRMIVVRRKKE